MSKKVKDFVKFFGVIIIAVTSILLVVVSLQFLYYRSFPYYSAYYIESEGLYTCFHLLLFLIPLGLFFILLGSSHGEIGKILAIIGLCLTFFGLMTTPPSVTLLIFAPEFFIYNGFAFGYISGPILIFIGVLSKIIERNFFTIFSSSIGSLIFCFSFINIIDALSKIFSTNMPPP